MVEWAEHGLPFWEITGIGTHGIETLSIQGNDFKHLDLPLGKRILSIIRILLVSLRSGLCDWVRYLVMILAAWCTSAAALWSCSECALSQVGTQADMTLDVNGMQNSTHEPIINSLLVHRGCYVLTLEGYRALGWVPLMMDQARWPNR